MKTGFEVMVNGVKTMVSKAFAPEILHPSVYWNESAMLFRREGRELTAVAEQGGYTGRQFSGKVNDARRYALNNHPDIGYGGCITLENSIKWGIGRGGLNMHVHITDPLTNLVINMPSAILRHQFGEYTREPGSQALTSSDLIAEQEFVTLNDVPLKQFLASFDKEHITLLNEGALVPNQLRITGIDSTAPEVLSKQHLLNRTSMMLACMEQGCQDKAEVIATRIDGEKVLKEAGQNNYEKKTQQQLFCFWKAANPTKECQVRVDKGISVCMAAKQ
jgi:hypothetical protein